MRNIVKKWHSSIGDISQLEWLKLSGNNSNPFYEWEWLYSLEKSNSIIPKFGWQTLYLSLWRNESIISIAPLYLKAHSYGEFIFDQQFAELANQFNLNYYPKLIGMSPLSPIEGYRFLYSKDESLQDLTKIMMNEIDQFCIKNNILSCNFLYVDPEWRVLAEKENCAVWINQTSLWSSNKNKDFTDYLSNFNANQRRNIKRERKSIEDSGIQISVKHSKDINLENMKLMYKFYENHCARWGLWGSKYLSETFFEELSAPIHRNKIVLFVANRIDISEPIAMSLCVTNGDMLWGRYWGCKEEINFLHFEMCYYSPISWALNKGIKNFDPGAGGNQKRRRGFLAKPNTSLHRWYEPRMDKLIRLWLPKANNLKMKEIKATNNEVPFKINQPKLSVIE